MQLCILKLQLIQCGSYLLTIFYILFFKPLSKVECSVPTAEGLIDLSSLSLPHQNYQVRNLKKQDLNVRISGIGSCQVSELIDLYGRVYFNFQFNF